MADTIHVGDHTTECDVCKANCSCGTCEQNERIKQNMEDSLEDALANGDLQAFEDIFEDRDPFEFI